MTSTALDEFSQTEEEKKKRKDAEKKRREEAERQKREDAERQKREEEQRRREEEQRRRREEDNKSKTRAFFSCLWRYRDLKQRGVVNNRPQLKKLIDEYGFPPGKLLSPNTRVWTDQEIFDYYAGCPSERKPAPVVTNPPSKWKGQRGRPRKAEATRKQDAARV
jgi:ATP-dependent 26S proteasome regulatory subunit